MKSERPPYGWSRDVATNRVVLRCLICECENTMLEWVPDPSWCFGCKTDYVVPEWAKRREVTQ